MKKNKEYGKLTKIKRLIHKCIGRLNAELKTGRSHRENVYLTLEELKSLCVEIEIPFPDLDHFDDSDNLIINLKKIENRIVHSQRRISRRIDNNNIKKSINKILEKTKQNSNFIFNLINQRGKRNVISRCLDDNQLIMDKEKLHEKIKATWENHWRLRDVDYGNLNRFLKYQPKFKKELEIPKFLIEEIKEIIHNHHNKSAPGNNKVTWRMWKAVIKCEKAFIILKTIMESAITFGIPKQWRSNQIILLEKQSNTLDIEQWRPICLLQVEYKIYSTIINKYIVEHVEQEDIYH